MFKPYQGICSQCKKEKMVDSVYEINDETVVLCASCLRDREIKQAADYQEYLKAISDPRD